MKKFIVNFTPTGMIPTKRQTPHVPVTSAEILRDVKSAWELGITMVHLHVRNAAQEPDYKKETYAELISGIREFAPELVICVSTSGRTFNDFAKRADVLQLKGDLKPDMASLTLSSLNFNRQASINEPAMIMDLAKEMLDNGIKPELEVFDSGMINYGKYLISKGLLKLPCYFTLILGNIACAQADLLHIGMMIRDLPEQSLFSLGGVGDSQLTVNSLAIAMGYGVRVGLEDNLWYDPDRTRLATNLDLLQRIHDLAQANQRQIMSPAHLRTLLDSEA
jgi:3-keto-5-aminohexanoate cleavage enzyme